MAVGGNTKTLSVVMRLRDQYSPVMRKLGVAMRRFRAVSTAALRGVGRAFKTMIRTLTSLKALLTGLILIWGARKFWGALMETNDRVEELQKLAIQTGETTEYLSEMQFVLEQSGNEWRGFVTSLRRGSANLADAARNTGEAAEAFRLLGVDVIGSDGNLRKMSDLLPELADKFSAMEDATLKNALAADIFGRSGGEMLRFLNRGSSEIERLRTQAEMLGLTVTQLAADRSARLKDSLNTVRRAFTGLWQQLVFELAPALSNIADAITAVLITNRGNLIAGIKEITGTLTERIDRVAEAIIEGFTDAKEMALQFRLVVLELQQEYLIWQETALRASKVWGQIRNLAFATMDGMMGENSPLVWTDYVREIDRRIIDLSNTTERVQTTIIRLKREAQKEMQEGLAGPDAEGPSLLDQFLATLQETSKQTTDIIREQEAAYDGLLAKVGQVAEGTTNALRVLMRDATDASKLAYNLGNQLFKGLEGSIDAMYDAIIEGGESMGERITKVLRSMAIEVGRLIVKYLILKAIMDAIFGSSGGPGGGDFVGPPADPPRQRGDVVRRKFAGGGIVAAPSYVNLASGVGSVAERSPELIAPIFRKNGVWGVANFGGSTNVTQNISIQQGGGGTDQVLRALYMHGEELARVLARTWRTHSGARSEARTALA
jgi:hypothetical protein